MGQYLSSPVTEKHVEDGGGAGLRYGASAMQGWRVSMEDAHISQIDLAPNCSLFAVFDGHGGHEVAMFCQRHMPQELVRLEQFRAGDYGEALRRAFHRMDEMIASDEYANEIEYLRKNGNESVQADNGQPQSSVNDADALRLLQEFAETTMSGANEEQTSNDKTMNNTDGDHDRDSGHSSPPVMPAGSTISLPYAESNSGGAVSGADSQSSSKGDEGDSSAASLHDNDGAADGAQESGFRPLMSLSGLFDGQQCKLPDHRVVAGCTAIAALVTPDKVTVANAGDSKAVLSRNGTAVGLSFEHKPFNEIERRRIENAGGFVSAQGRVNNNLNLSRSIGDLKYKRNGELPPKDQMITAEPDLCTEKLSSEDEFMILACDGVWDIMRNQDAVTFVRERLNQNPDATLSSVCNEIFDACVADDPRRTSGLGGDNMTCVLVQFQAGART